MRGRDQRIDDEKGTRRGKGRAQRSGGRGRERQELLLGCASWVSWPRRTAEGSRSPGGRYRGCHGSGLAATARPGASPPIGPSVRRQGSLLQPASEKGRRRSLTSFPSASESDVTPSLRGNCLSSSGPPCLLGAIRAILTRRPPQHSDPSPRRPGAGSCTACSSCGGGEGNDKRSRDPTPLNPGPARRSTGGP